MISQPRLKALQQKAPFTLLVLVGAFLLAITATSARAANPAPVQIFYVSEPEDDTLDAMQKIEQGGSGAAPTSPMRTTIAISIRRDTTVIYYDHWEDGFADDIANPTAGEIYANPGNLDGAQIWGDGDATNGAPPGFPGDVLNSGDVVLLQNDVVVPNLASTLDYDGKDKIGATNFIAITRSIWATASGSLLAFATALYDTVEWGQTYIAPVGCDTPDAEQHQMFEYAAFSVTAGYDGTVVEVDTDGNGTFETTSPTLDEGETYFIDQSAGSGCDYIKEGAKIRSTDPAKPTQAVLWTGDIGSNYESRDLNMVPDDKLDNSYFLPVGVNTTPSGSRGPVRLYIYNLEADTLFVRCEAHDETWDLTISAGTVNSTVTLDNNQGAHCFAVTAAGGTTPDNSRAFTGLAAVDSATESSNGQASNWGVPFVPEGGLSNQVLIGLGLGRDPTSGTNPNENGSPIWVTPVCATFFYVDWNNDGTPDKVDFNGDNDVTDDNVDGVSTLDETTSDQGFSISPGRSARLFNSDTTTFPSPNNTTARRQTGGYIFTNTAANLTGTAGCEFAAAWGQDSRTASAASPGMDLGTVVVNLRSMETSKASELLIDAAGNGVPSPGDTIRYLFTIENTGLAPIAVSIFDGLPAGLTYVPNSTEKDITAGFVAVPDGVGGNPLDDSPPYGLLLGTAQIGETFYVRFNATIDEIAPDSTANIVNCALLSHPATGPDPKTDEPCDTLEVYSISLSGNVFNDTNGLGDNTVNGIGIGQPGGTQVYANLVDPNGGVVAVVPVNNDGTYQFDDVTPNTTYTMVLSTTQGTQGNPAPAASLPPGWVNTGENLGAGAGNDGTVNGVLSVPVATSNVTNANFGIQQPVAPTVNLSGNVFNDTNGLNDNTVNGTGIGFPDGTQLYANLVDPNGNVVAVDPVAANGAYDFANVTANTTYTVVLATTQGIVGNPAPAASLPAGWINTGENLGAGAGNDGNPNGVLSVLVATTDVTNANFGIQELVRLSGNVFNDTNGLIDNTVNGSGIGSPSSTQLYANLVDPVTNDVLAVVPIAANGTYGFDVNQNTNYKVVLSATQGTVGNPAPAASLPAGWTNTGENVGAGAGNDGTVDGTIAVSVLTSNVTNVNFGIQANPVNLSGNVFNDTNGLTDSTVNGTGIGSPDGTQLYANLVGPGGTVVAVDDVAANGMYGFTNVAANTTYTVVLATTQGTVGNVPPAASLPAGWVNTGENLGAGAGSDGTVNGVLSVPVATTDVTNANFGIQQTPISLSGNVYNDANGLNDNTVNGTGIGSPSGTQLYANLTAPNGNVVAVVPVNADGTYQFNNVTSNTTYTVVLSTTSGTVGNPAPAAGLPAGWVNTGENLGAGAGSDGSVNGVLSVPVATTDVTNANFGIQQVGQIGDRIWHDYDGDGIQDAGEPGISGITVSLDPPAGVNLGNGPGNPVTAITDLGGNYLFSNLPAGNYTITVTPPFGMTNTGDPDGGFDSTSAVSLSAGQSNLNQDFGYQSSANFCPVQGSDNALTDIFGLGMGNDKKHKLLAKIALPFYQQIESLYGQLAGKDFGKPKYVRFLYPNNQFVQVDTITSPASQVYGTYWFGAELNPAANIRGRWFLQSSGAKSHTPRAMILYPTYRTELEYVNVFEIIEAGDSQVFWQTAGGWRDHWRHEMDIPAPLGSAALTVKVAMVDKAADGRPIVVTVSAGGVSQTQVVTVPNKKDELSILTFNLAGITPGTAEVVIEVTSPQPNSQYAGPLGGDSVSIVGMTANYACIVGN